MAQHRIGLVQGLVLGFALVFGGSVYLAWATNPLTGLLTLLTAVAYVAIYTPLKRITTLNTFIGAFPGALPPLLGWTAARGLIEWPAVALFAILFVWQFPHFMAIGWMYRADYAMAGIRDRHPVAHQLGRAVVGHPGAFLCAAHDSGQPVALLAPCNGLAVCPGGVPAGRLLPCRDRALSKDYAAPRRPGKPGHRPPVAQGFGDLSSATHAGPDAGCQGPLAVLSLTL
jgi:hypothetical protein